MRMLNKIYEQLLACPKVPPECGGILGSQSDESIRKIVFDKGIPENNGCVYSPNVGFLNKTIAEWTQCGIEFRGIFHTHAPQWIGLSKGDIDYIIQIVNAMPSHIHFLYFPLVFPGLYIRGYCAKREGGVVGIFDDGIEII